MVRLFDVKAHSAFGPLVENPLQTSWVSVQGCLVDGLVAIIVLSLKNLVSLASSFSCLEDIVQELGGPVGTLRHDTHEGELVMFHFALTASETHFKHYLFLNY